MLPRRPRQNLPQTSLHLRALARCLAAAALLCGCDGPPVPTPIEGEPVCADFEVGASRGKMRGGLKFPVTVAIKEDDEVVMRATLLGLRQASDVKTRILLRDTDAEYTVEWSQCENQRAPRPADSGRDAAPRTSAREEKGAAQYECGKATPYKTEPLVTKKGDLRSHTLQFPTPPNAACWAGEPAPPAATTQPATVADAGPPDAEAPDAGAADAANQDAAPAGIADASTDAAPAASAPADAGKKKKPATKSD